MSKAKKRKSNKLRQRKKKTSKKNKYSTYFWKCFAGFAVILGVIVALYPKLTVTPKNYLDPKNPLKTLFEISNDSFLPLYDVKISCAIQEIKSGERQRVTGVDNYQSRLFNPSHVAKKISYGESDTVYCPLGALDLPFSIDYADIAIVIDFSPPLISKWRIERTFPFTTQKNVYGDLVLVPHPLNK